MCARELCAESLCPGGSRGEESACTAGDLDSTPGLGRSPGEGHGYPLQYSCLESPTVGGAFQTSTDGATSSCVSQVSPHSCCITSNPPRLGGLLQEALVFLFMGLQDGCSTSGQGCGSAGLGSRPWVGFRFLPGVILGARLMVELQSTGGQVP